MRHSVWMVGASIAGIAAAGVAHAQSDAARSAAEGASVTGIEDIIVTASRRSETLKEVPTAISAYGGEQMKSQQILSLTDVSSISPNIQITSFATNANVAIRGIGNSQIGAGADPGVAVHVDGVYLAQPGLGVATFLDVQRVEILRGPQGTLFGRNATGGAVNIVPSTPSTSFEAGIDAAFGVDPAMIRSSAFASGPLTQDGTLLGRVAVMQNWNKGFTRNGNPAAGGQAGSSSLVPRRLDNLDVSAIRAQLEWRPSEIFKARLSAEYQRENDNGMAAFMGGTPDPAQQLPIFIQGFATGDPKRRIAYANMGAKNLDAYMVNLFTETSIGGGDLKTTLSYAHGDNQTNQDGDGTSFDFTNTGYRDRSRQYYAEALYASDAGRPFNYVLGANYFDGKQTQNVAVPVAGFSTGLDLNGDGVVDTLYNGQVLPVGDLLPVTALSGGTIRTRSYAAFAHAQYELAPGGKVFAGGRYSHDRKSELEYNSFAGTQSQKRSWSKFTYEIGASYAFSPQVTGYAKYASGYKSGGFATGSFGLPVDPETNKSIELGLKGSYFGGRLQSNIAAFHMKYDNLQVSQVRGTGSALSNAAKATIDGVELELSVRPVDGMHIGLTGAYTHARFDEFTTEDSARPYLGTLQLAGNLLPQAPRWNGSIDWKYDLPLSVGTITPEARYDWKSRMYFSEFNTDVSSQKAIGQLNLYLHYKSDDGRWSGSLFATNVTDAVIKNNVLIVSALLGSLGITNYRPGRQLGVSVGYHFK